MLYMYFLSGQAADRKLNKLKNADGNISFHAIMFVLSSIGHNTMAHKATVECWSILNLVVLQCYGSTGISSQTTMGEEMS